MSSDKIPIPIVLDPPKPKERLTFRQKIKEKRWIIIKSIIFITTMTAIAVNTFNGYALPHGEVECFEDYLFQVTKSMNTYLLNHKNIRHSLVIASSLGLDLIVLVSFLYWVFYSDSWRIIISLFLFYFYRCINQQIFAMEFPNEYLWEYPGFPSLVVSYLRTRDFFFSGHVGISILLGLEWNRNKKYLWQYLCWFICAFEFVTMLLLRGHYSIDLISGIVFSHYFFLIGESYAKYFDSCKIKNINTKLEHAEMVTMEGETTIDDHYHV